MKKSTNKNVWSALLAAIKNPYFFLLEHAGGNSNIDRRYKLLEVASSSQNYQDRIRQFSIEIQALSILDWPKHDFKSEFLPQTYFYFKNHRLWTLQSKRKNRCSTIYRSMPRQKIKGLTGSAESKRILSASISKQANCEHKTLWEF